MQEYRNIYSCICFFTIILKDEMLVFVRYFHASRIIILENVILYISNVCILIIKKSIIKLKK